MHKELKCLEEFISNIKLEIQEPVELQSKISRTNDADFTEEKTHHLFDFLNTSKKYEDDLIEALGGLLPEAQGEDYVAQDLPTE